MRRREATLADLTRAREGRRRVERPAEDAYLEPLTGNGETAKLFWHGRSQAQLGRKGPYEFIEGRDVLRISSFGPVELRRKRHCDLVNGCTIR